jgi:hypothetical protein
VKVRPSLNEKLVLFGTLAASTGLAYLQPVSVLVFWAILAILIGIARELRR